jgi:hypothetical protein
VPQWELLLSASEHLNLLEARRGKASSEKTSTCVLFQNIQLSLKWRGHVPSLSWIIVPRIDVSSCPKSNRTGSRIGLLNLLLKVHEPVTTAICNLALVLKGIFNYLITFYELFKRSVSRKKTCYTWNRFGDVLNVQLIFTLTSSISKISFE